jgi:hypothetical protein
MNSVLPPAENSAGSIRILPRQNRALGTLGRIEDAIRAVLRDPNIGRDRFTTQHVAQLAGVSIGTVYRYFPSRVGMLDHVWPDRQDSFLSE